MTTTATGDASTIRELDLALRCFHGDEEAWRRLGGLLKGRRVGLDRRYANRRLFTDERCVPLGLNYKLIYDLEGGAVRWGRKGFPAGKMLIAAEAYAVTPESIGIALAGGDLVPAPAPAPVPAPVLAAAPALESAASPPPAVMMSGVLSPAAIAAAAPYATEILMRLRDLAVAGIVRPSGRQLFPDSDHSEAKPGGRLYMGAFDEAAIWDRNANDMPDDELAWLIAARRVLETSARRDRTVV